MEIIQLNQDSVGSEHICCAMSDPKNRNGVQLKKEWLSCRFEEGLVFKKLDVKGKVFIEYLPAENAWVPVDADGFMYINCFWVAGSYKGQGHGARLLEECLQDSKEKSGVVAISSNKKRPYLTDKSYLIKHGFEVCDTAPPYFELLVKRLDPTAPLPRFKTNAKRASIEQSSGLVVMYTNQCPFTDYYVHDELDEIAKAYDIQVERIKISTREAAQQAPSAVTTYSAFYNGKFLTHEILSKSKFDKLWKHLNQK